MIGASRTDAGVHALGNVAVFDTQARMGADKFTYALNQRLPEDIRIRASREVPSDFHPRKTDSVKTYEYHILNEAFPNPLERLYSHFCYVPLDESRMQRAHNTWRENTIFRASAARAHRWRARCAPSMNAAYGGKARS